MHRSLLLIDKIVDNIVLALQQVDSASTQFQDEVGGMLDGYKNKIFIKIPFLLVISLLRTVKEKMRLKNVLTGYDRF